jgi:hypothetical protein
MENDVQAQDVNQVETDTTTASSSENQTISNAPQDDAGHEESKYVPYDRFKEVNEGYQQSLARLEELENTIRQIQTAKDPAPEVDPQSVALKEQLRQLGFITKEEQVAEVKRQKEDLEVQQELSRLEKTYDGNDGRPKFDRKGIVKFAIERGIGDLEAAYKLKHETDLVDWHIKQAISKSKGIKTEASDGSGSAMAGTSSADLKEAARKGDKSSLKTLIKRIALGSY